MSSTFSAWIKFTTPIREGAIHELARADFNGDGIDDLIAARFLYPLENRGLQVQVLAGDGSGGFADKTATIFDGAAPTTVHPRELVVADFNGDGRPDVFIADHGYDAFPFPGAQNRLILSTGTGQLRDASANLPQRLDFTHSATAGDIDGDGDIDIYVGNVYGEGTVAPTILVNDGTGQFTPNSALLPGFTQQVAIGATFTTCLLADLDRDGRLDLVLGTSRAAQAPTQVLINPGNGNFSAATSLPIPTPELSPAPGWPWSTTPEAYDIQTINLNGDALPDLVVVWTNAGFTQGYVQLLVNDGGAAFRDETAARMPQAPGASTGWIKYVHLQDFNKDGHADILTEPVGPGATPILYLNSGTGTFAPVGTLPLVGPILEPVDANRDGLWDVVAATGGTNAVFGLLTNVTAEVQPGTGGNDVLQGGGEDDALSGGDGKDSIFGGGGDDTLNGDNGNDYLEGDAGMDVYVGGAGADVFFLQPLNEPGTIDWSTLNAMDQVVDFSHAEGDRLQITDASTGLPGFPGSANAGTYWGTWNNPDGTLPLVFSGSTNMPRTMLAAGLALPSQPLNGLAAYQVFWVPAVEAGLPAGGWVVLDLDRDSLLDAQDLVFRVGSAANPVTITAADFVAGTFLTAGTSAPPVGTAGNDTLTGGSLTETFLATGGSDRFDGSPGANNTLSYQGFTGPITVTYTGYVAGRVAKPGGAQDEFVNVSSLVGTAAADRFDASLWPTGSGYFAANVTPGAGADTVQGNGTATVQVNYTSSPAAVEVDLAAGTAKDGFGTIDSLIGITRVTVGSAHDDTVRGSDLGDVFSSFQNGNKFFDGRSGEDQYRYNAGSAVTIRLGTSQDANGNWIGSAVKFNGTDTLVSIERARGSGGNDSILGSGADNRLAGNEGADTLDGGNGYDIVEYDTWTVTATPQAPVLLNLTTGTATDPWGNTDLLLNIEAAWGTQLGDDLTGIALGATRSMLRGLAGNDLLRAPAAGTLVTADYLGDPAGIVADLAAGLVQDGWGHTDQLFLIRSVRGSAFADTITGSAANDVLEGAGGDDLLVGGAGRDIAILAGTRAQTSFARNPDGSWTATGPAGTDILKGIEVARFADGDRLLLAAPRDFTGTGSSDILFRATDGSLAQWQMDGLSYAGGGGLWNPGLAWSVAGIADLGGDGRADILWRHADGSLALWQMDGTAAVGSGGLGQVDLAWSIAGLGDFNGDGRADILWRHADGSLAQWWMDGTAGIGGGGLGQVDNAWQVAAVADFNGDARADILWRHADGSVAMWLRDGLAGIGGGALWSPGPAWSIAGAGDFNADGRADILWRGPAGEMVQWWMDGATYLGGGGFATVEAAWKVANISDFNADGRADLLWRNDDGGLAIWQMDGLSALGTASLYNPGSHWQVV